MDRNFDELKDWKDGARRELSDEADRLKAKYEQVNNYLRALEAIDGLISKIDTLVEDLEEKQTTIDSQVEEMEKMEAEIDSLRQQLQEEKEHSQTLEMQLNESRKLSKNVAKKSSHEELIKALQAFVNKSKQKRIEKRTAVKEMVLELVVANSIVLPVDLAATIESLDDEQLDPKVVNVTGNYNDIHDNDRVDMTDKQKSDHGRK